MECPLSGFETNQPRRAETRLIRVVAQTIFDLGGGILLVWRTVRDGSRLTATLIFKIAEAQDLYIHIYTIFIYTYTHTYLHVDIQQYIMYLHLSDEKYIVCIDPVTVTVPLNAVMSSSSRRRF